MWAEVVPMVVLFLAIVAIVKIIADNRTKAKLIEARPSDEVVRALFAKSQDPALFTALKWGLVISFVGAGLVAVSYLGDFRDPITYGFMLVCGGGGLLAYYWIATRVLKSSGREGGAAGHEGGSGEWK